jgi:hypothetical protein
MTLKELYEWAFAQGHFAKSRQGPMKTHVMKYARFLEDDWSTCQPDIYHQPEEAVRTCIEAHLATSDLMQRSKDNHVKDVFALLRVGATHGQLRTHHPKLIPWNRTTQPKDFPYERPKVQSRVLEPYALGAQVNSAQLQRARAEWKRAQAARQAAGLPVEPFEKPRGPTFEMLAPQLAKELDAYLVWCTPKIARDRPQQIYKTPRTQHRTRGHVARVAGFAVRQGHDPATLTLKTLCDAALLEEMAWWWIQERVGRNTCGLTMMIEEMKTIARYYVKDEDMAGALVRLYETLPAEEVVIDKDLRMLTLEELDWIGQSVYPLNERRLQDIPYLSEVVDHVNDPVRYPKLGHGRSPTKRANGRHLAMWAEASLIIRLMVRRPLRQINVREMMIDTNLVRLNGSYELRFAGDELKVRQRRVKGRHRQVRLNRWVFHFPHELQWLLQEYLDIWRPKLLQSPSPKSLRSSPYLLINSRGRPFDTNHMARVLEETTWRYTQQRPGGPVMVNPHQVRTIWATRMLKAGLNIIDVARFLGDKIQTVYDKYVTLADESPPPTAWELELAQKIAQRKD